jgi:S-adenosylmethionine:tRNA ribosyltransferase-isomerase
MSAALAHPPEWTPLEAHEPPEARGAGRDDVRLLVAYRDDGRLVHARFGDLPDFLRAGDLLVLNTSATLAAALDAVGPAGQELALHLSSPAPAALDDRTWVVEVRRRVENATVPWFGGGPEERLLLPGSGLATLIRRYRDHSRLWIAELDVPEPLDSYLARHARPIRYAYVDRDWPLEAYQTVYATEPGSAEMPSAGRALTPELLARLVARGVHVAPVVLHTGVSSLEHHEPPYPERFRVPAETARLVNAVRSWGGRVIAVGTTVVRALESVASDEGTARPGRGWTNLVVSPERGVRVVDGLLTGWHEPQSSHLQMLEAIGGRELIESSYRAALEERYLWHEFGDLELILPG